MQSFGIGALLVCTAVGFVLGLLYGSASGTGAAAPHPVVVRHAVTLRQAPLAASAMVSDHEEPPSPLRPQQLDSLAAASTRSSAAEAPFLLIGVISNPAAFARREMLRSFATASGHGARRVQTEFVFGDRFYKGDPSASMQQRLAAEAHAHGDIVFVDAREKLPHVGKATEKSAAWWRTAPRRADPRTRFFCKTDDDSLIHHEHISAALAAAEAAAEEQGSPHVFFSYIRWRGWLPHFRFQACGGGWGGPVDAIRHIEDPKEHCELAEGPFPQGTGQLTCLSRDLARALSELDEFESFRRVAMARNDFGAACETAQECARHPPAVHMWHHEDAGISYNVWRAVQAKKLRVTVVHMPEKGWIWPWFSPKISGREESSRAILMHKVTPATLPEVTATWQVGVAAPDDLLVDCSQTCTQWGWKYARTPCVPPPPIAAADAVTSAAAAALDGGGAVSRWRGFGVAWNHSHCKQDPVAAGWKCCFLSTGRGKEVHAATRGRA